MRDEIDKFKSANMQPFGVNPASVDSHRGYVDKMQFNFPLLSDPERTIATAYHALKDDGRGIQRTVYVQFGGLDILVNVAGGFFSYGPFTEVKPEILDRELAVNFKTAFYMCQAAVPLLLTRGGGSIVNFASIAVIRSLMHMSAYSAAKSAVAGLTRELAREYRDADIRVNAVAPATVRTGDNVAQMGDAKTPFVELEDVVNTVAFLASDEASAITGQIVPITGKAY